MSKKIECILYRPYVQVVQYKVDMAELVKHGVETNETDLVTVAYDYWMEHQFDEGFDGCEEFENADDDRIEGEGDLQDVDERYGFKEQVEKMMVVK